MRNVSTSCEGSSAPGSVGVLYEARNRSFSSHERWQTSYGPSAAIEAGTGIRLDTGAPVGETKEISPEAEPTAICLPLADHEAAVKAPGRLKTSACEATSITARELADRSSTLEGIADGLGSSSVGGEGRAGNTCDGWAGAVAVRRSESTEKSRMVAVVDDVTSVAPSLVNLSH
jgi:hypothetical protein